MIDLSVHHDAAADGGTSFNGNGALDFRMVTGFAQCHEVRVVLDRDGHIDVRFHPFANREVSPPCHACPDVDALEFLVHRCRNAKADATKRRVKVDVQIGPCK